MTIFPPPKALASLNRRALIIVVVIATIFNIQARAESIISFIDPDNPDYACLVIFSGQGGRVGWTQADAYADVSVSAQLSADGTEDQTGQAFLTTQIGPGTTVADEIATTNFIFPNQPTEVLLFDGLQLPAGAYYLSIISDSIGCWTIAKEATLVTEPGITALEEFGDTGGVVSNYYPASPYYDLTPTPPDLLVTGINITHPLLQITQSGESILISWTTNSGGFFLESANAPTSTNWTCITHPITTISDNFLFETNASATRFYRLKKQSN